MNYIQIEEKLTRMKFIKVGNNFAIVDTSLNNIKEGDYFITQEKKILQCDSILIDCLVSEQCRVPFEKIIGKVVYETRTPEYLYATNKLSENYEQLKDAYAMGRANKSIKEFNETFKSE